MYKTNTLFGSSASFRLWIYFVTEFCILSPQAIWSRLSRSIFYAYNHKRYASRHWNLSHIAFEVRCKREEVEIERDEVGAGTRKEHAHTHLIKRVGNEHLKFFVAYQRVPLCGNINDLIVLSVGAKTAFWINDMHVHKFSAGFKHVSIC